MSPYRESQRPEIPPPAPKRQTWSSLYGAFLIAMAIVSCSVDAAQTAMTGVHLRTFTGAATTTTFVLLYMVERYRRKTNEIYEARKEQLRCIDANIEKMLRDQ